MPGPEIMKNLLREISVIPGVWAACIFDRQAGVVCAEYDDGFPKELTEQIALHFVRLVQMAGMNNLSIKSTNFRFDRYCVVCFPLEKGAVLLAVCDSQANSSLVTTTAAMLVDDMRLELDKFLAPSPGEHHVPPGGNEAAEPESFLGEIGDALAAAVGPAAGTLMEDYTGRWRANGPAVASRLAELIKMLEEEIGDAGQAADFRGRLAHLL